MLNDTATGFLEERGEELDNGMAEQYPDIIRIHPLFAFFSNSGSSSTGYRYR